MLKVIDFIHTNRDRYVNELKDYLAIPSVSTDPAYKADIERAAQYTADQLAACGLAADACCRRRLYLSSPA